jgi:ACS family D-galactonate transporter-like MFS transporter
MVVVAVIGLDISASNVFSITQTLAGPRAAGRWTGFQCFVGNLEGVVVPAVTGFVVQRTGHFYWALIILACVALTGTVFWVFLVGPIRQVVWHENVTIIAGCPGQSWVRFDAVPQPASDGPPSCA